MCCCFLRSAHSDDVILRLRRAHHHTVWQTVLDRLYRTPKTIAGVLLSWRCVSKHLNALSQQTAETSALREVFSVGQGKHRGWMSTVCRSTVRWCGSNTASWDPEKASYHRNQSSWWSAGQARLHQEQE